MALLLLGSDNLAEALKRQGFEVITCACSQDADIPLSSPDPDWPEVASRLRRLGVKAETLLLCDRIGGRVLPTGLWAAPLTTVFYGLDSPLNFFWQEPYSRLFDIAALDQKEQAQSLGRGKNDRHWLPVAVEPSLYQGRPASPGEAGVCFVGVVDENIRPKRSAVLAKVKGLARLKVGGGRQGQWLATEKAVGLYQGFQISLNENLFPGVTTRPLEIMAAGGCLLSEAAPGQMDLFFSHGRHLFYYTPGTLEEELKYLLADPDLRARLARQGREEVLARHSFARRAEEIAAWLARPAPAGRAAGEEAWAAEGESLLWAGLRWPDQAAKRLERALGRLRLAARSHPCPRVFWLLGLNEASLGQWPQALTSLAQAHELGAGSSQAPLFALSLSLALYENGRPEKGREILRRLGVRSDPGQAAFHARAARLLDEAGCAFTPGFSRRRLWPGAWNSLEHWSEAAALSKDDKKEQAPLLLELGRLLLRINAPNQAWDCFRLARNLGCRAPDLEDLLNRSGREGYIL
ncbi:MAG: glycosyltransferase [Desulfarculales bacterium]|jgi:hypothetical protein|nr:glycosyltransferase [Desulfarculales bacterium]